MLVTSRAEMRSCRLGSGLGVWGGFSRSWRKSFTPWMRHLNCTTPKSVGSWWRYFKAVDVVQ